MLHKKFFKLLICSVLFLVSYCATAKDLNVVVKLVKIEVAKSTERRGDELYFSIAEYAAKANPQLLRVPMFPLHWLAKELPQLKNIVLWKGVVSADKSVLLVLSLLEQDLVPLDPDDLVGSVQVKLSNNKGKLVSKWEQTNFKDQPKQEQPDLKKPQFIMHGKNSKYVTEFKVEVVK